MIQVDMPKLSSSHIFHPIKEFTIKVQDINLTFRLNSQQKFYFRSYSEQSKDVYKNLLKNQSLSESLKYQFSSVDKPPTHFEFNANQFQCKFTRTQKDNQSFYNDNINVIYEISLLSNKDEENPQNQKKLQLEKLQEQQNKMKKNIEMLYKEQNDRNQSLSQKKIQFSSLTKRIAQAERQIAQITKRLQEMKKKQEVLISDKTMAQKKIKQLFSLNEKVVEAQIKLSELKAKLLQETRKKQVEINRVNNTLAQKSRQIFLLKEQKAEVEQVLHYITIRLEETNKNYMKIKAKMNQSLDQNTKQSSLQVSNKYFKADQQLAAKTKLLKEIRKKQVLVSFKKYPKYGEFIIYEQQSKMGLCMPCKNIDVQMMQEIAQCDLSRLQLLFLGGNLITDIGFDLLFKNKEWPVLQQISLSGNKIQNISQIHKIHTLKYFSIQLNQLSEASCNYIWENQFLELAYLKISFKLGLNDKCWEKLLTVNPKNFPKLEQLQCFYSKEITQKNKEKIDIFCKDRQIRLYLHL